MKNVKAIAVAAVIAVVAVALVAILIPKYRDVLAMGKDGLKS